MTYEQFLARIIDDGITAARADYMRPEDAARLRGSVDGFEACRGLLPEQLGWLLGIASRETTDRFRAQAPDYWYWRSREAEIEWVCNCVSAALLHEGRWPINTYSWPICVWLPTLRGIVKTLEVLNSDQPARPRDGDDDRASRALESEAGGSMADQTTQGTWNDRASVQQFMNDIRQGMSQGAKCFSTGGKPLTTLDDVAGAFKSEGRVILEPHISSTVLDQVVTASSGSNVGDRDRAS